MSKESQFSGFGKKNKFSAVMETEIGTESSVIVPRKPVKVAKSKDPAYMKVGLYLPKLKHRVIWERLVREDRELSDLFEQLADGWLEGRFQV